MPRRRVRHLLWHYRGKLPRVAVGPPSPAAAQAAAELAAGRYFAPRYRVDHARALLRAGGERPVEELLGLMAHPPPTPPELLSAAWEWVRRVQVLAALAVAQLDGGWQGSLRREVLLDLADGPEDWSVEAALAALVWVADTTPEAQPEIALHLANRVVWVADAHRRHHLQTLATTCQLALAVPGIDPAVTDLAAKLLDEQDGDA